MSPARFGRSVPVLPSTRMSDRTHRRGAAPPRLRGEVDAARARAQSEMLAHRVVKNRRKLAAKFERAGIGAYRLYDRDIPEIRAVVDWYEGHVVVGEYERRQTAAAGDWVRVMGEAVADALGVSAERLHLRRRRTRPAEGARYGRLARREERLAVREGDLRFLVNLDDYLDTGLFPDHRITRRLVREECSGRRMLNLFAYTGGFTVAAARGGASGTLSVDQSGTYLSWLSDNLEINDLGGPEHVTLRVDVVRFLRDAIADGMTWDVIVLDPPSFSTLGGSAGLDLQRDHRKLVLACLALLSPGGTLWFATAHQRFEPELEDLPVARAVEMTERTVPEDYRNRQVHRCWRFEARA